MIRHSFPVIIPLLAFHLLFSKPAFPQSFPFRNYTVEDGLAQSSVNCIIQDSKGYLWFGTHYGASKFDGKIFTNYSTINGLAHDIIKTILEDKDGNIWFGTYGGGVTRFDGKTWKTFSSVKSLADEFINSIIQDKEGNLWFGTKNSGVTKFDGKVWKTYTTDDGLTDNWVYSIFEDSWGNIWFGTNRGVTLFNGNKWKAYTILDGLVNDQVSSIFEDSRGNMWFGTNGGVSKFDGNTWSSFTTKNGLADNSVSSILEDKEGNLWFTTRDGANKFDGKLWTTFNKKNGIVHTILTSIIQDIEGNLWFGTVGGGVIKLRNLAFQNYSEKDGLANNLVFHIIEDKKGNFWFATYGGGVSRFDGKSWSTFSIKNGLPNNFVLSILQDKKGNFWFGTMEDGVIRFDGSRLKKITTRDGLAGNEVFAIFEDSKGNLWFGTDRGVNSFDGKIWMKYTTADGLVYDHVDAILEDRNGNMWFGTYGGGVSKFDGKKWLNFTVKDGLAGNTIVSIFEDNLGNLWFGTEIKGISKYDGKSFFNYTVKDGLSDNFCYCITQLDKYLYFGTNKGVNRFDGKTFRSYDADDGLAADELNLGSCFKDSKGNLWFGTTDGASKFNPRLEKINDIPPPVYITRVALISDEEIEDNSRLKYDDNYLKFEYCGICLATPENLIYSYKLEGMDSEWYFSNLRNVQYTNLRSGHYTFKVRARNKDGIWSQSPATFNFVINPPFWKTWWFIISSTVFMLGIIFGFFNEWHKHQTAKQLRKKNLELKNTLEKLDREISERLESEKALDESQRFLSALMSHLPGMAYRCRNEKDRTLEYASEGCFELTGYYPADLILNSKVSYGELIHADDREIVWLDIQAALLKHQPFRIYYRLTTAEGKEKWLGEKGSGIFDPEGKLLTIEGFVIDITDSIQAMEELKEAHKELESKVEERTNELRQSEIKLQQQVRILNCLYMMRQEFDKDISIEEILVSCTGHIKKIFKLLDQVCVVLMLDGQSFTSDLDFTFNNIFIDYDLIIAGKKRGYLKIFFNNVFNRDQITEKEFINDIALTLSDFIQGRELILRNIQAEKLTETSRLALGITKEINDPLAAIKNALYIIKKSIPDDHPDYGFINLMDKELNRASSIVGQLYELYSLPPTELSKIEVGPLLKIVLKMLETKISQKGIIVENSIPDTLPTLNLPAKGVKRVLYNVLDYTIENMLKNGKLALSTRETDLKLYLEICNKRPVKNPDIVFKEISQTLFTEKNNNEALRLGMIPGLSSPNLLMESLGGSITVRMEKNKEITLILSFPKK